MHLRSIKLRGFKSFPDPVEVTLEPGVAVVVGPNGSGKSNISDAVVWAAGSLTPSALRAEKPDDVLFAGGGDRKPAEHCEVELVFDNEDGAFTDLDYREISIVRRLVRGGEGQYLVNRASVRRTDLVELLADVGLGGAMHSIVGQGKVDAVLASKPEDRRALVEEAAGLGRFKQRRHRAELKLDRVATQVERARDVEDEVRKRLRPLALQATAAERAEKLGVEIARLRARVAELDLEAIAERHAAADDRRQAAALHRRSTQERLTALLAEREVAEDELSDAAGRREAALGALYRLQGAAERLTIRRETATALEEQVVAALAEAERAVTMRRDDGLGQLEQAARQAAADARDAAQASGQAAERARLAHARVAAVERGAALAAEERLASVQRERHEVETALAAASGGHSDAHRRLLRLGTARERLLARQESAAALADVMRREHDAARKATGAGEQSVEALERLADEAAAAARAAATERDELDERARSTRDRLLALERAIAEREGVAPAARALAESGETLALAALDVLPGHERAVAAALGWRASAVLARNPGEGLELLRRARDTGLGTLTVLAGRHPQELIGELPVVALDDLLGSPKPAVTTEGFGFDPAKGELWFAGETAEAVLLEMDARRRALADEADELDARAAAATAAAQDAAAAAQSAEAAYSEVAHLRGRLSDPAALQRLHRCASQLEELVGRAAGRVAGLEAPVAAAIASGTARSEELGGELRRLASLEAAAAGEAAEARDRAQAAEVVVARLGGGLDLGAEASDDRDGLVRMAADLLSAAERAAEAAREASDRARVAETALGARAPRESADPDLLRRLAAAATVLGESLDRGVRLAERFQAPVRARADAGAQRSSELGAELRRLGAAEVEVRREAEEASEKATAVEIEIARLDAEAEEARRRLGEAGADEPAEGDDREELQARVERLEARREGLGRVNPLAKEEYEAEKLRLEELAVQRQDLETSLSELEQLRDELAETVKRRFDETFASVARNFEEVAATLFPGGEGRLRLVEDEDELDEPGVEVELRPAGKRVTRLSLLSGGEKALGAISFLFALFLAKPCPFYLLDEVEAALDDTNIARFVDLLRRYSDRAQFVVVTHQKRTMEAADVLYGVTMGGDGVSQIVSRRLPRHEQAVAVAS